MGGLHDKWVIVSSALDVAYRVLSLLALGIVLLGSAYLFGRFRPTRPTV